MRLPTAGCVPNHTPRVKNDRAFPVNEPVYHVTIPAPGVAPERITAAFGGTI